MKRKLVAILIGVLSLFLLLMMTIQRCLKNTQQPEDVLIFTINLVGIIILPICLFLLWRRNYNAPLGGGGGNHLYLLIFVAFAVLGILLRAIGFGKIPAGLNQDEASMLYEANTLLKYGIDRNGYSFPVYLEAWGTGQNALLTYLTIPFVALFGMNIYTARIVMLLVGIGAMFGFFWLIWLITKNKIYALIGFAVFAICPWSIMASRWGLESDLFPFIFIFILCFLVKANEGGKKQFYLFPACFLIGLSLYAYATAWLFLPLFLIGIYLLWLMQRKIHWGAFVGANVLLLLLALPLILFLLVNWGMIAPIKIGVITIPRLVAFRSNEISLIGVFPNAIRLFELLIWQDDGFLHNSPLSLGFMYILAPLLMVIGLISLVLKLKKAECNAMAIVLISFVVACVCALLIDGANVNKINFLWISYLLIMVFGVVEIVELGWGGSIGIVCSFILLLSAFVVIYFGPLARYASPVSFKNGLLEAIEFAQTQKLDTQKIYFADGLHEPYIYCLIIDDKHPQSYMDSRIVHPGGDYSTNGFDDYVFNQPVNEDTRIDDFGCLIIKLSTYQESWFDAGAKNVKIFDDFVVIY